MDSLLPILMATALAFGAVFVLAEMSGVFSAKRPIAPATVSTTSLEPTQLRSVPLAPAATQPFEGEDTKPTARSGAEPTGSVGGAAIAHAQDVAADASDDLAAGYAVAAVPASRAIESATEGVTVDFPLRVDSVGAYAGSDPTTAALERNAHAAAARPPTARRDAGTHRKVAMPDPATYGTSIDQMGLTVGGSEPADASLLDAPTGPSGPAPAVSPKTDATAAAPDLFADPEGAAAGTVPRHAPPAHPKIFDASENTPMDPLRNKSFDLNSAKSVPTDLGR